MLLFTYGTVFALTRHTKEATLNGKKLLELPPKIDDLLPVDFTPEERASYDSLHAASAAEYAALRTSHNATQLVNKSFFQVMSALPSP
jgi:hypothetical protein